MPTSRMTLKYTVFGTWGCLWISGINQIVEFQATVSVSVEKKGSDLAKTLAQEVFNHQILLTRGPNYTF